MTVLRGLIIISFLSTGQDEQEDRIDEWINENVTIYMTHETQMTMGHNGSPEWTAMKA